jgi:hypothetical protein
MPPLCFLPTRTDWLKTGMLTNAADLPLSVRDERTTTLAAN